MNWDTASGNWTQFKGKVKERDQHAGKIQEAGGISRADAERQIEGFERTIH